MYSQQPESAPMPDTKLAAMPLGSMLMRSHWKNSEPSSAQPWRNAAASTSPVLSGELMDMGATVFHPYTQLEAPVQQTVAFARTTRNVPVGMWIPIAPAHTPSCTMRSVTSVWSRIFSPLALTRSSMWRGNPR